MHTCTCMLHAAVIVRVASRGGVTKVVARVSGALGRHHSIGCSYGPCAGLPPEAPPPGAPSPARPHTPAPPSRTRSSRSGSPAHSQQPSAHHHNSRLVRRTAHAPSRRRVANVASIEARSTPSTYCRKSTSTAQHSTAQHSRIHTHTHTAQNSDRSPLHTTSLCVPTFAKRQHALTQA
jgi:hypothetical protein